MSFLPNQPKYYNGYYNPPTIEDVQNIITPLPLPSQLPKVNLPSKINVGISNTIEANPDGLILNQNKINGYSPRATFVVPPSIIKK